MRKDLMKFSTLLIILLFAVNLSAQTREWKTELSEDGTSEVVYAIYDSVTANGEDVTFIEYNAKTKTTASLANCAAVFNNHEMHKKFYEYTEISEKYRYPVLLGNRVHGRCHGRPG